MQKNSHKTILFLLILIALGLRFFYLAKDQFWMDEAYSAIISNWSLWKILKEVPGLGSPPLYNLGLHFWIQCFGDSEWILRSSSVLFGILLIPLVYWVGQGWFDKKTGLLAALVVTLNVLHIFYSQQTRLYASFIFLSLLCCHFLFLFFKEGKKIPFLGYTLTLLLLLYWHNWALFLIPVPYFFMALNRTRWAKLPKILISHFLVFVGYLPFLPSLLAQSASGSSSWVAYFWQKIGPEWAFLKTFEMFFAGGQFMTFGKIPYGRIAPAVLLVFILLFSLQTTKNKNRSFAFQFLLCALLVPLLIPYLFSFYRPIYISGRYDTIVFGLFAILIAAGFANMPKKVFIPVLSLFLVLSALNLTGYYFYRSPRFENRRMARFIDEKASPGDLLVFTGYTRLPIEYYLKNKFNQFDFIHYPQEASQTLGYFDYPRYLEKKEKIKRETQTWSQTLHQKTHSRIWVLNNRWLTFIYGKEADLLNEPLYESLLDHTQLVQVHHFRKAFIVELKPNSR